MTNNKDWRIRCMSGTNLRLTKFFALFCSVIIFSSCASTYTATSVNAPIFSNKGEFQIRAVGGSNGGDLQLAYAATKHLGVMANGSFDDRNENNIPFSHKKGELGVGYYSNRTGRFVTEVFGGFGAGNLEGEFNDATGSFLSTGSYSKAFLQPGLGITTDVIDLSLATRISVISIQADNALESYDAIGYLEPALTLGFGFRFIKAQAQIGFCTPLMDDSQVPYTYQPIIFNLGLAARIGKKFF